jgi:hypothetical protein
VCLLAHLWLSGLLGALTLRHDAPLAAVLPVDRDAARFALTPFEPACPAATSGPSSCMPPLRSCS